MKLTAESTFRNANMPDHIFKIKEVNEDKNILEVFIRRKNEYVGWIESGWNLQHTLWAFERGEYFDLKPHTP